MKQLQLRQSMLLLTTATIWGVAFVAQRVGMDHMGPLAFSTARFWLGGAVLIPVVLVMRRAKPRELSAQDAAQLRRNTLIGGLLCGLIMCVGANLQQFALLYTTVGKAGFLTALYIIFVPLIGIWTKQRAGGKLWVSVAVAVCGLYLLCMEESLLLSLGDTLAFLCAFVYSFHILVIDRYSPIADGVMMSCIQFFVAAIISLVLMLIFEPVPTVQLLLDAAVPILYTGVLSSGVAYTLQIIGQKHMNPTVASLILSLESVIAALAGWVILKQGMTHRELFGASLMFLAILLAQLPERRDATRAGPTEAR